MGGRCGRLCGLAGLLLGSCKAVCTRQIMGCWCISWPAGSGRCGVGWSLGGSPAVHRSVGLGCEGALGGSGAAHGAALGVCWRLGASWVDVGASLLLEYAAPGCTQFKGGGASTCHPTPRNAPLVPLLHLVR